ncbi:MAG TPA: hypothetical protein VLQ20_10820 [Planococcus sp. (in: firmicutes)]|nr:hypothetical protein [Planococcus sp. (in: firmicutes)]
MNERFNLSFKNKEVRMWFYIMLPIAAIGFFILFSAAYKYNNLAILLVMIGWLIYYIWRFQYRKKKIKETGLS